MSFFDRWQKKDKLLEKKGTEKKEKQAAAKAVKQTKAADVSLPPQAAKMPRKASRLASRIILRPVVTEKTAILESRGQYTFRVTKKTNKEQIKRAVSELYGVKPLAVRIVNVQGKQVRFGRFQGRRQDFKKAIIILKKGESIAVHEGV